MTKVFEVFSVMRRLSFVLFVTILFSTHVTRADGRMAITFVESFVIEALEILDGSSVSKLDRLFGNKFAVDRISKFVVGPVWRSMTSEQTSAYEEAFRPYVVNWIHRNLIDHIGAVENYTIQQAVPEKRGDRLVGYTVLSSFDTSANGPTDIQWRLRIVEGQLLIVDIIVTGVSISMSQRDFFQNTMERSGGVDGLILFLKNAPSY